MKKFSVEFFEKALDEVDEKLSEEVSQMAHMWCVMQAALAVRRGLVSEDDAIRHVLALPHTTGGVRALFLSPEVKAIAARFFAARAAVAMNERGVH